MFDQEGTTTMSVEEVRIRGELEKEIERDLEEEIKDGIYRLALRLHRFYLREKERKHGSLANEEEAITQVSITIRMEGATKVEIDENKKNGRENARPRTSSSAESGHVMVRAKAKKFDWAGSLRSEPRVPITNEKEKQWVK
ncbi:uncharacterized protein LOC124927395 [Impatiens glandulifera]|uniref:uncharacterized protein LOC124927395 n=1 Tax=Impatiens glandulifera TaxID=253017 RepID=UPI001FB0502C|nr:uncharacterized protein LOC124927395 [Impatiens glandulifera]